MTQPAAEIEGFPEELLVEALVPTDADAEALIDQQRQLEQESMSDAAARIDKQIVQGRGKPVTPLFEFTRRFSDALDGMMGEMVGRPTHWSKLVRELGAERVSHIVTTVTLSHLMMPHAIEAADGADNVAAVELKELAREVIGELVFEARTRRLKEQKPGLFHYQMARLSTSRSKKWITQRLTHTANFAEIPATDLDYLANFNSTAGVGIGINLIDTLVSYAMTGLLQYNTRRVRSGKKVAVVRWLTWTESGAQWASDRREYLIEQSPVYRPMVVPPNPWSENGQGGYIDRLKFKPTFVRSAGDQADSSSRAGIRHEYSVYDAVNAIQATAWRVNRRVLDVVTEIVAVHNGDVAGIPWLGETRLPSRPHDIATNEQAREAWKRKAGVARTRDRARLGKVHAFRRTEGEATKFAQDPAIYFPHSLDFRGRVYPIPKNGLTPQGNELQKALLEFAEGKPLGESGENWLAIHGANVLGETRDGLKMSKMAFRERIEYINAITPMIERIAADPMAERQGWQDAGDPFSFLAFCFEWAEVAALKRQGRGVEFISHLPCAIDGSCNGMQHYAMMLRDEPTAKAVNVVPSDRPQDIYHTVAEKTKDKVALDACGDDVKTRQFAQTWLRLNLINRKLAKGPTMTLVYGAVAHSFAEKIRQTVREERGDDFVDREFGEENAFWAASMYLARVIEAVIKAEAPAAAAAMEWLRKAARRIAKETNQCVEWIVPLTGFRPRQDRFTYFGKPIRVDTFINGETRERYAPTLSYAEREVDVDAQADGIAPNVIHSLDAAALQVTAILAKGDGFVIEDGELRGVDADGEPLFEQVHVPHEGVTSFAMIHDGYGTHASDVGMLAQCARNAFHWLYGFADGAGETYLDNLRAQWREQFGVDLDPPPRPGTLSPNAVLSSAYFFA